MTEDRRLAAQGFKDLDLSAGIGDVVLTPNDVSDAEFNIINTAWKRVEIRACWQQMFWSEKSVEIKYEKEPRP